MTEITTPEALDALPVGSVVLDGMGDAWQRSDADTDWWAPANPFYAEADAANVLEQGGTEHPATLIHRPVRPSDLAVEVERLRATVARVAALLPAVWRVNETPFVFADDIEAALVAAPSETETGR